jgi:hypothetical protein
MFKIVTVTRALRLAKARAIMPVIPAKSDPFTILVRDKPPEKAHSTADSELNLNTQYSLFQKQLNCKKEP